jgi:predicted transcriptional regulator
MSKITFRADSDLIDRVERLEDSKSQVMREALRAYLDEREPTRDERGRTRDGAPDGDDATLDEMVAERIDALLAERLESAGGGAQDLDLTISLDGVQGASVEADERGRTTNARDPAPAPTDGDAEARTCGQCGSSVNADHVYCPNCGEKATRRVFCECGDELRSDWSFCPGCGRRTPAADVLDGG